MKKIFGLFLFAGMLAVTACGSGAKEEVTTTDSTTVTEVTVDSTTVVDTAVVAQ